MIRRRLTAFQLFWAGHVVMFPTIVLVLPGDLARLAGRHAWLSPLVAAAPGTAFAWLVGAWAGRHGDLPRAALRGLGPIAGRAVLLVAWAAVGAYLVVIMRETVDLASATFVTQRLPAPLLDAFGLLPATYVAWLGPLTLGRTAIIQGCAGLVAFLAVVALALPASHLIWTRPFLPQSARFARPAPLALVATWFAEPALVGAVLVPWLAPEQRRFAGRALALTVAWAAAITAATLWLIAANVGPALAPVLTDPFATLIRSVRVGTVQNLNAVILPLLIVGSVLKLAAFLFVWARLGAALAGGWPRVILLAGSVATGVLGIALLPTQMAANQVLGPWIAQRALPALAAVLVLVYLAAGRRPRVRRS